MTEVKKDVAPAPDAPKGTIQERRIVLPEGGGTPEEVKQAVETYKKAKMQFETKRKENETKQKELEERKAESGEAEAGVAAQPPFDKPKSIRYEIPGHTYEHNGETKQAPNVHYTAPIGTKIPDNAVNIQGALETEKPKSQEEIALEKKREEEKKLVLDVLAKKHDAEIEKVLGEFDFSTLTDEEKKTIHASVLSAGVDASKISEEDKKEALKGLALDGKIDLTKLTPEQTKMIQQYKAKKYLEALAAAPNENIETLEQKNPGIKNFIDEVSKRHPLGPNDFLGNPNRFFDQEKFFEEVKKDPSILAETIKSIREEGFLLSGIQRDSKLGQALSGVIKGNVEEYLELNKANPGVVDIDHFKGLKNVLGGSYNDLLFSDEFLLGESHELNHTRDVIMQLLEDEIAQIPRPEPDDTAGMQQFQEAAINTISSNTGANRGVAEKVMGHISRGNLSPFVRFLADLFAPLGALFGGEVGEFWRRYLHETGMAKGDASGYPGGEGGSVSSSPHGGDYIKNEEGKYMENVGSGIIGAAQKYLGVNESKDDQLIREMHQSGGVNGGGGTAWCMSFVQHVLRKDMGYTDAQIGTGKTAWAADGTKMGKHVAKEDVQPGDIALVHGEGRSGYHIGFVAWVDKAKGTYGLLGGNQGKGEVSIREEKIANAREFRGFEARKESSQPNPQVSDGKEAVGNTAISQKALEWQKAGDIHGAVHCTDWVNKIYQEVTGKRVYDSQTFYNGVRKIGGGTGIGGVHAPKEQIANIREGQHLIVDHGNNGGKTHSVIALGTPDSAGRVQVVSYPNYGKPPKVEMYTLGTNTAAGEKRVLRIQGVGGGGGSPSVASTPSSTPAESSNSGSSAPESSSAPVSGSDVDSLIEQIKQNESGDRGLEGYATYDNGENFPSMGFAHFIWGTNTAHGNSFHDMMNFITQKRGIAVPEQLNFLKNPNPPSRWNGETETIRNSNMRKDPNYRAVTEFLSRSDVKRAGYDFIKNDRLASLKSGLTGDELHKFNLIAQGPKGAYILTDYVNFKGPGEAGSRTKWGLVNVLEAMQMPSNPEDAARKFSEAAKYVLRSRRPADYARFSGWAKRVEGYA